jgi:ABC-type Na+ efflux pump permease subunit
MIHEHGTSAFGFAGMGFGAGDEIFVGGGTSQSIISGKVAPPERKSVPILLIAIVGLLGAASLLIGVTGANNSPPDENSQTLLSAGVCLLVIAAIFLVIAIANMNWNSRQWPARHRRWQSQWMCRRCGTVFQRD